MNEPMNDRANRKDGARSHSRRSPPGGGPGVSGWRLQLAAEGLMSLTTRLDHLGPEGPTPAEPGPWGVHTLWQNATSPVFSVARICHSFLSKNLLEPGREQGYVGVGEADGRDGGRAQPASLRLNPWRNGIKTKETLGVDRKGWGWVVTGLLLIQTRAEQMNRFNTIIS